MKGVYCLKIMCLMHIEIYMIDLYVIGINSMLILIYKDKSLSYHRFRGMTLSSEYQHFGTWTEGWIDKVSSLIDEVLDRIVKITEDKRD